MLQLESVESFMTLFTKSSKQSVSWFWIGMAIAFLLWTSLRFWGLSRFNLLVFDEVYYAKYGNNYLTHTRFFDVHPPLGKYLIAIGIWIGTHLPFGQDSLNRYTGSQLSTFSYRWLNALTGSLIPLVVGAIAYQLTHRRSYAFIAALLIAMDGLFLVESRYALLNVYLIIFGLLGQLFFLITLDQSARRRGLWLALSGVCFGASASVKWYGLGFLLGIFLIWSCAWVVRLVQSFQPAAADRREFTTSSSLSITDDLFLPRSGNSAGTQTLQEKLAQINIVPLLLNLGLIPIVVYSLVWIPHLLINPKPGLWELHQQMLAFHKQLGSGPQEHPYCSAWYTWPWMIRPMGYLFQQVNKTPRPVSSLPLPSASTPQKVIEYYDVHGMGNPILWWLSAIAIIFLLSVVALRLQDWMMIPQANVNQPSIGLGQSVEFWIMLYLVLNYGANYLPWMMVSRCSFIYYYMGASIFGFLALGWLVDQCLQSYHIWLRAVGVTIMFLISLAFIFWLPVFLGLPLSPQEFQSRMWLPSWI
jgi:dolichyl-phosphate-mannose--protein O-mannosyl transferase